MPSPGKPERPPPRRLGLAVWGLLALAILLGSVMANHAPVSWPNCTANTLTDSSGNGHTLTTNGNPPRTEAIRPKYNYGYALDGVNDNLTRIGDTTLDTDGSLSIFLALRFNDLAGTFLVHRQSGAGAISYEFTVLANGSIQYSHRDNLGLNTVTLVSPGQVTTGDHQIWVTRDTSAKRIVINADGVVLMNATYATNPSASSSNQFILGSGVATLWTPASIFEARIWHQVIPTATLTALANPSLPDYAMAAVGGEVGLWYLDDCAASTTDAPTGSTHWFPTTYEVQIVSMRPTNAEGDLGNVSFLMPTIADEGDGIGHLQSTILVNALYDVNRAGTADTVMVWSLYVNGTLLCDWGRTYQAAVGSDINIEDATTVIRTCATTTPLLPGVHNLSIEGTLTGGTNVVRTATYSIRVQQLALINITTTETANVTPVLDAVQALSTISQARFNDTLDAVESTEINLTAAIDDAQATLLARLAALEATLSGQTISQNTNDTAHDSQVQQFWADYNQTEADNFALLLDIYNNTESSNLATVLARLNLSIQHLLDFWADYNFTSESNTTSILAAIQAHAQASQGEGQAILQAIYAFNSDYNATEAGNQAALTAYLVAFQANQNATAAANFASSTAQLASFQLNYNNTAFAHYASLLANLTFANQTLHQSLVGQNANMSSSFGAILLSMANHEVNSTVRQALLEANDQEILDAIGNLTFNVTVNGNATFQIDNDTLNALSENLTHHRDDSLEVNGMSFDTLGFDGMILTLLWFLAVIWCLRNGKAFAAAVATLAIAPSFLPGMPDWVQLFAIALFTIALWLEAILKDRLYQQWLGDSSPRRK